MILLACTDNNEPSYDVFSQVSEISNDESDSRHIAYDSYGRVSEYEITSSDAAVSCSYSYTSDDCINITTKEVIHLWENDYVVREYDDELFLDNGRASFCDGIFKMYELKDGEEFITIEKKYRHEFEYTAGNHLNVVKWTEWNKLNDDRWALDKPWTWDVYYITHDGNLSEIEDYAGKSKPYQTYRYTYSSISGVQNIVAIHYGRHQYYPLQLKGILGAQPDNLIVGVEIKTTGEASIKTTYEYQITDNKISSYTETVNGVSDEYSVTWAQ